MRACLYARKSVAEKGRAEEASSIAKQLQGARAFAEARGWEVVLEESDTKSGAEFKKRPGLQRMLAAAKRRDFEVLIVAEQKALGREMSETAYLVKRLGQSGVEIWGYLEGKCLTPHSTTDKLISTLQGFSDEDHRAKTSLRMHEAHARIAKAGQSAGGRVYGYRSKRVYADKEAQVYLRTIREIDPTEAAVVRKIFKLYDSGLGFRRIAERLNSDHHKGPRGGRWNQSAVRGVLHRENYSGVAVWGKRKMRDDWGELNPTMRPDDQVTRVEVPHLRIVKAEIFARVRARLADNESRTARLTSGQLVGRPPRGREVNLLAGLAKCGLCGSSLVVESGRYTCSARRNSREACPGIKVRVGDAEEAILTEVEQHVLQPGTVEQFLLAVDQHESEDADRRRRCEAELGDVQKRETRLLDLVESGKAPAAVVERLEALQAKREALERELAQVQPVPRLAPKVVSSRLAEWRRILRQGTVQARQVLGRVLVDRISFSLRADGLVEFEAPTRFSRLFAGVARGVKREGRLPKYIKAGDGRGHQEVTEELERRFEQALENAETRESLVALRGIEPRFDG